jgi:hypothetical protein
MGKYGDKLKQRVPGAGGTVTFPSGAKGKYSALLQDVDTQQPLKQPLTAMQVGKAALQNIPESGGKFATDFVEAVTHPVRTAEFFGRIGMGVVQSAIPGQQAGAAEKLSPLVNLYAERYGGIENLKETIARDPIGFLADLSVVLGGAGAVAKGAGTGTKLANVGKAMSKTAGFIDPVAMPLNVGKAVIPKVMRAESQYAKALKLPPNLKPAASEALHKTGIAERIVPGSRPHYEKFLDTIDDLNENVKSRIDASTKSGAKFNSLEIVDRMEDLKKFYEEDPHRNAIYAKIDDLTQEFLDSHGEILTTAKAQKLKQTTYRTIRDVYSPTTGERIPAVAKKWRASFANALREKIVELVPEVKQLNEKESKLLGLKPFLEKALARREQHTMGGLSPLILATGSITKAGPIVMAREIINSPSFRARLAFALDRMKKRVGKRSVVITPTSIIGKTTKEEAEANE